MTRKETLAEGVELYLGDYREVSQHWSAVDLIVTSPPYAAQRNYVTFIGDNYESLLGPLGDIPSKSDTQILVNLGLVHKDGFVVEYWNPMKRDMEKSGWRLFGWYVWDKQDAMAGDWNGRLAPAHEFIFHFNKQARQPNKVVTCKGAGLLGYKGNTGLRRADGSLSGWTGTGKPTQDFKIADSVIRLQPQKDRTDLLVREHPVVFPIDLPRVLIDSYSSPGDTIADPFTGSGTTAIAAARMGRRFVGAEIEPKYFDLACRRISEALRQPDMFIEHPPAPAKQEAML